MSVLKSVALSVGLAVLIYVSYPLIFLVLSISGFSSLFGSLSTWNTMVNVFLGVILVLLPLGLNLYLTRKAQTSERIKAAALLIFTYLFIVFVLNTFFPVGVINLPKVGW